MTRPTPAQAPLAACSFEESVCVHAPAGSPPWAVALTLRRAEDVLRVHRWLGFPTPLPDGDRGGSSAFDIYLAKPSEAPLTAIDLDSIAGPFDRASAFAVVPTPAPRESCVDRANIARAFAHAGLMRLDAGAEPGVVAMASSYAASFTARCDLLEIAAVDRAQREPERAITSLLPGVTSASPLFPWYLDAAYGTGKPAAVVLGLIAVAAQRTPPDALTWRNEPDVFDALRASLKARGGALGDLLLDFAVARAFVGSRSDEAHMDDAARFGDLGRVRFEWTIPWDSLPRRLAPLRPIEPTGSTYIWLDVKDAPLGSELTFVADWELPAVFRWALVKIDPTGAEAGRVNVAGIYGASHAERTVKDLTGLAGVVVVGVNAGSMDRSRPFDPDDEPFAPHGYTVTLVK